MQSKFNIFIFWPELLLALLEHSPPINAVGMRSSFEPGLSKLRKASRDQYHVLRLSEEERKRCCVALKAGIEANPESDFVGGTASFDAIDSSPDSWVELGYHCSASGRLFHRRVRSELAR